MKELPGNVRVNLEPLKLTASVFGETFNGSAREFSSAGLSEVSTVAVPLPERLFAPDKSTAVSSGAALAFTTFTMRSPEEASVAAVAYRLLIFPPGS